MEKEEQQQQFWHYLPLSDHVLPQATVSSSIKGGIRGVWQRLRGDQSKKETSGKKELTLEQIPDSFIERIAPDPDWQVPAVTLKQQLDELSAKNSGQKTVSLVVGLPHGGNDRIMAAFAQVSHWQSIDPPTTEQILSQDDSWLRQIETCDKPWVIPALERCYLRHVHGLSLVRELFEKINTTAIGNGIIGCDSWALAYLKHVLPGLLPQALVAQPFDDLRLSRWFYHLALAGCHGPVLFCQTNNGEPVFSMDEEGIQASAFMNQLAAHSFGIPGIALSLWRKALKQEPGRAMAEKALANNGQGMETTLWVLPWDKIEHPSLPSFLRSEALLVLHALLLHNGLFHGVLTHILPFSTHVVTRTVWMLKDAGLIHETNGLWRISPSGYPVVRKYLDGEGYLTDSF